MMLLVVFMLGLILGSSPLLVAFVMKNLQKVLKDCENIYSEIQNDIRTLNRVHTDTVNSHSSLTDRLNKIETNLNLVRMQGHK